MPWMVKRIRRLGPFSLPFSRHVETVSTAALRSNARRHHRGHVSI